MTDENVILLRGGGMSFSEMEEEKRRKAEKAKQDEANARKLSKEVQLKKIDVFREKIASGELDGCLIVSQNTETSLFHSELIFPQSKIRSSDSFAWVGILETIKSELAQIALMTPTYDSNGLFDPDEAIPYDEHEDEEDFD